MFWAKAALEKLLRDYEFTSVLEIGARGSKHAEIMEREGKAVTHIDWLKGEMYETTEIPEPVDCIWASHVLEHMHNPGLALEKMRRDLKPDGILAITVPPPQPFIVGGHVSLWNAGLLLYRLILAGFDCSDASVKTEPTDTSVIVRRKDAELPPLKHDKGDIEALARFFPLPVYQGFNGNIESVNW